jgi:uncharacterized protein YndB with AHSA1/START domain
MTQTGASVEGTRVQSNTKPDTLRKTITVAAPREVAFRVFTQGMTTWWPLATHKIGKAPAAQAVLEPRVGGRWYEKGDDGSECDWGRVLAWDPPAGLSLDWQIDRQWQYDPSFHTEVVVRFVPEDAGRTRVELEHRNLDRFGVYRDQIVAAFDSPGGWQNLLEAFAAKATAAG